MTKHKAISVSAWAGVEQISQACCLFILIMYSTLTEPELDIFSFDHLLFLRIHPSIHPVLSSLQAKQGESLLAKKLKIFIFSVSHWCFLITQNINCLCPLDHSSTILSSQDSLQQQHLVGITSQTPTGTGTPASLATPPTTVHPVRQSSIAPPHLKSQRSVNTPATATPPKVRPQSRNLLLDSSEANFSGSQPKLRQAPQQETQLSVTDSPAPGLPYQTSSAKENQGPGAAGEVSTDTPTKNTKKSGQSQLQPPQQHLLKPGNKQVTLTSYQRTVMVCDIGLSPRQAVSSFLFRVPSRL